MTIKRVLAASAVIAMAAVGLARGQEAEPLDVAPVDMAVVGPIDLRPKFVEGETVGYDVILKTLQARKILLLGDEDIQTARLERRIWVRVLEKLDDGGARVELTHGRIRLEVKPPNWEVAWIYDSAAPNPSQRFTPQQQMLDRIREAKYIVRLNEFGRAVEVENTAHIEQAIGDHPAQISLGKLFDDEWAKSACDDIWCVSPDAPAREIGDAWSTEAVNEADGIQGAKTVFVHRLVEATPETARIEGVGELKVNAGDQLKLENVPAHLAEQSAEFEQEWDREMGMLASLDTLQMLDLRLDDRHAGFDYYIRLLTHLIYSRAELAEDAAGGEDGMQVGKAEDGAAEGNDGG
ncbi:MAG: hypothetical protein VYC34_10630 [Planctomycetota bacterium]|nr:hypothetical protein [Planctomycetota bacterium]